MAAGTHAAGAGETMQLVTFRIDGQRHALALAAVERVLQAVAVTPLPGAPAAVLGVVDMAGEVVPVFSLRHRFGLAPRQPEPADQFLLARTPRRLLALLVEEVQGVVEREDVPVANTAAGLEQFDGVARLDDGLLLILDVDRFLSPHEEQALDEALGGA